MVRNPIFVKKQPEQQLTLLSKEAHTRLLTMKPVRNSKQFALVYSSIDCIWEQMAFQIEGVSGSLKVLKQTFLFSILNTALHSCSETC